MWNEFFAEKEDVEVDEKRKFRVYRTKKPEKPGPVLLLLHGGGYSALTWAHFCVCIHMYIIYMSCEYMYECNFIIHLALQAEVTSMIHCQCLCIDLRGHGDSKVDDEDDLSADTLSK